MTTQITDDYAAAWIEARGRIQVNSGNSPRFSPMVRVIAIDPALPNALREHFGGGDLDYFSPLRSPHMTLYTWEIRGAPAVEALRRTIPHMVTDLREDAERAVEREEQKAGKEVMIDGRE